MGNMCGSAPGTTQAIVNGAPTSMKSRTITTEIPTPGAPRAPAAVETWRKFVLSDEVLVKSVHPHILKKFRSAHDELARSARSEKKIKSAGGAPAGEDDSYDEEEDNGRWLCNGSEPNRGFKGGCKSGQKDFDFHVGTEGW